MKFNLLQLLANIFFQLFAIFVSHNLKLKMMWNNFVLPNDRLLDESIECKYRDQLLLEFHLCKELADCCKDLVQSRLDSISSLGYVCNERLNWWSNTFKLETSFCTYKRLATNCPSVKGCCWHFDPEKRLKNRNKKIEHLIDKSLLVNNEKIILH